MKRRKLVILLIIILISSFFFLTKNNDSKKNSMKKDNVNLEENNEKNEIYNSNIIKDVNFSTKDKKGNEYTIYASQGEIEFSNTNIVYLTEVKGVIKLKNSNIINISSNFGKYNSDNFDTIFSKNVIIKYLDNIITGDYLDLSLMGNLMTISKKVTYKNKENILEADVVEMNIDTKDTKIFMYEDKKKVNIRSLN